MAPPPDRPISQERAFGEREIAGWMERYGPALRRHFRKRGAGHDADDLVQEVFLRLQAGGGGGAIDNVERYLFRIANNALVSRHRHEQVERRTFEDQPGDRFDPVDELSPERVVMGRQALARFVVGLGDLPPRTRSAFLFHRFEEMTYPAIARRMGISVSAVEKLIIRALEQLGEVVGPVP